MAKVQVGGIWIAVDPEEVDRAVDNTSEGLCPVCGVGIRVRTRVQTGDGDYVTIGFCSDAHLAQWADECPPDEE